jgi:hypothetical protein
MAKDPAYLFYTKDWLEGTAELYPEEKGVYVDLLCYQHQRGYLPTDKKRLAKMIGIGQEDFERIWEGIKHKFIEIDSPNGQANGTPNGKALVNQKMSEVVSERSSKGKKNKLIGTFAHVLKSLDVDKKTKNRLKQEFNVDEMIKQDTEWTTERLTEWCHNRLAFIANGDGNANGNNNYKEYAEKLSEIIQTKKNIKHTSNQINSWAEEIRKLCELNGVSGERINKALDWYGRNIGGQYIPVIESGAALRDKFTKLENAIQRNQSTSKDPSRKIISYK